jgi:hypothetical protein
VAAFKAASTAALPALKARVKADAEAKFGVAAVAANNYPAAQFVNALDSAVEMDEVGYVTAAASGTDVMWVTFFDSARKPVLAFDYPLNTNAGFEYGTPPETSLRTRPFTAANRLYRSLSKQCNGGHNARHD